MISSDSKTIFLRFGKYSVGFRNYILANSETTASDLDSTAEDSGIMFENYFRIFFLGISETTPWFRAMQFRLCPVLL